MAEVVVCSSSKEAGGGLAVVDVHRGGVVCGNFKNSISDAHCLCVVGGGSSFSGMGMGGDFIIASQFKKPILNVYQWGKPQVHQQCHIQEITTALCCDVTGTYLVGGTKKGWIYCWEIATGLLLLSWQAHFKVITKVLFSSCGNFCISCSEDGMARTWDIPALLSDDAATSLGSSSSSSSSGDKRKSISAVPYRSWSPHTLSVKDMAIVGGISGLRLASVSLDHTAVLFDLHANKQCFRAAFPQPLESICVSRTGDMLFLGASSGQIFVLDISLAAVGLSAAHTQIVSTGKATLGTLGGIAGYDFSLGKLSTGGDAGYPVFNGHSRAVTALACSIDNCTLISASEDGSIRVWDMWTRQCLRESKPLQKTGVSCMLLMTKPELLGGGIHRPSLTPMEHLKKYHDGGSEHILPPRIFGSFWDKSLSTKMVDDGLDLLRTVHSGANNKSTPDEEIEVAEHFLPISKTETTNRFDAANAEEDFLSFSTETSENETQKQQQLHQLQQQQYQKQQQQQQHQLEIPSDESELIELRRRVAELERDNSRWLQVATGLKRKLEGED